MGSEQSGQSQTLAALNTESPSIVVTSTTIGAPSPCLLSQLPRDPFLRVSLNSRRIKTSAGYGNAQRIQNVSVPIRRRSFKRKRASLASGWPLFLRTYAEIYGALRSGRQMPEVSQVFANPVTVLAPSFKLTLV